MSKESDFQEVYDAVVVMSKGQQREFTITMSQDQLDGLKTSLEAQKPGINLEYNFARKVLKVILPA